MENIPISKTLKYAIVSIAMIGGLSQIAEAKEVCAYCKWDTTCGAVPADIVRPASGKHIAAGCPDRSQKLMGLKWTEKSCAVIFADNIRDSNRKKAAFISPKLQLWDPECEIKGVVQSEWPNSTGK